MLLVDAYNVRARLAPAMASAAPLLFLAIALLPPNAFSPPQLIATVASIIGVYVLVDLSRQRGKRVEHAVFAEIGGKPSVTLLRHSDASFDAATKARYVNWLGQQLSEAPPTSDEEHTDPQASDAFYERCGAWLREQTRDKQKFNVLFEENITYGFRRNLYGLRSPAISLSVLVGGLMGFALYADNRLLGYPLQFEVLVAVLGATVVHALYFLVFVTKAAIKDAADQYARQLVLSTEVLMQRPA